MISTGAVPSLYSANGHYYELIISPLNFNDALAAAEQKVYNGRKGHLATVATQEEYNFVTTAFTIQNVWIAATDNAVEGTFRWVAGPEIGQRVALSSALWAPGEPNNQSGENCMYFRYSNLFNDGQCAAATSYLVEYDGIL